jgi:hypothetical protein
VISTHTDVAQAATEGRETNGFPCRCSPANDRGWGVLTIGTCPGNARFTNRRNGKDEKKADKKDKDEKKAKKSKEDKD